MRCHPGRWLWGLIPIAMLAWLAVQVERSAIEADLTHRSEVALAAAGHDWAVVAFDGRDGLLAGQPASEPQRREALALVSNVWGVRVVRTRGAVSPADPTPVPARPTSIDDVPISPSRELRGPDGVLGDQQPEPIISSLEPDGAAHAVHHAAVVHGADAPQDTVRSIEEHAHGAIEVASDAKAALPSVQARDVEFAAAPLPAAVVAEKPAAEAMTARDAEVAPSAAPPLPEKKLAEQTTPELAPAKVETPPSVTAETAASESTLATSEAAAEEAAKAVTSEKAPRADLPEKKPPSVTPDLHQRKSEEVATATASPSHSNSRKTDETPPARAEPAVPVAQDAPKTVAKSVDIPERKPNVLAVIEPPKSASAAAVADPAKSESKPTSPAPSPRFETAALPPGNIAAYAVCSDAVKAAAQRVEVHFARGDARLDSPGKSLLDGLAAALKSCPEASLRIAGHADASGKPSHNQVLSRHRARGVASYLAHKGIDARRLAAVGYGDSRPVAPNDSQANRARNRRIELTVTSHAGPLPPMPIRKQGTRSGLSHR